MLTTYQTKNLGSINNTPRPNVGLDFGISKNITTSDNKSYNVSVPEDEQLKRLQRKLARSQKSSKNRYKLIFKIRKNYEHMSNQKKDKACKILHELFTKYQKLYFQDESLSAWKAGHFGKQVQHSCLGLIKTKLQAKLHRTYMLNKFFPSTKLCYICGTLNTIALSERVYKCTCGLVEERDLKAAKTILYVGMQKEGFNLLPTERRDVKPVESQTSIDLISVSKSDSVKQEAS